MRYVIAGAGPAGISAAKTLRQLDRDGEIVLVSKDDQVHSRCMLHKYLGGERDAEGISFIPPGFFKQNNITWYPGRAMVRLDCAERRILLDDGTFLPYDRLLLATGAYYLLPPVPGLKEAENVYGFRDLSDALAIDKAVRPGARGSDNRLRPGWYGRSLCPYGAGNLPGNRGDGRPDPSPPAGCRSCV